jgi:putative transposase
MSRRRTRQLGFEFRTWGGKREGAGRKRRLPGKPRVAHRRRPRLASRFPVHVTVRLRSGLPRLRRFDLAPALRRAFARTCRKDGFRICQFSIQGNHVHLVCEAKDAGSLSRGMQGFCISFARRINRKLGRKGSVFADRFHQVILRTPRQVRHALCYVLQNARRHGLRIDPAFGGVDAFSSAWWFDGWSDDSWRHGLPPPEERTVAPAHTWLLKEGWRRQGLIAPTEIPASGPGPRAGRAL